MKNRKYICLLVIFIIILSFVASAYGIFSKQGPGQHDFQSLHGQTIQIYGKGLYLNDSVSEASQAKSQDIVTLFLGIPLLIISIYLSRNGFKGRLLLAGTLGYFLYTYAEYTFFAMYNQFFLLYVLLMSASFFAFILTIMSFDMQNLRTYFNNNFPVKFIGGFLIFIASIIGLMWIGMIVPSLINGSVPAGLEHYTTMVIQGLDLGILVPSSILSGVMLIKKKALGYLFASILTIKSITMLTALTAMVLGQISAGVNVGIPEIIIFPIFNLVAVFCLYLIMRNIKNAVEI